VFLVLMELLIISLAVFCFVTQITIPLFRGTPLFPFFKKEEEIKREISETKQELEEARLTTEKRKVEKEIEKEKEKK